MNPDSPSVLIETDAPPSEAYATGLAELRRFTTETVGAPDNHDFAVLIPHPETGEPIGGLWGQSRWGGFHIDMLIVPEIMRGTGVGSRLMEAAEAEARWRGCHHMWLDTYSFQARPFYERFGFEVFGQLDGPPPIYPRFFMRKILD
ncbi:GNAT family N-acetyltransferase [Microvirga terricola]|uniref:GNAT family N-acetyltransferase n=1 Tax=Microvirga terricola TaxID=2719797 RepID=A0ABX0VE34_9HYPH|nr:GNAT family N-acetyltransferase [Microvirga terricola]NIX76591.1 GNAT family N-acetyltransferase [Microvirga terricola]